MGLSTLPSVARLPPISFGPWLCASAHADLPFREGIFAREASCDFDAKYRQLYFLRIYGGD